MENEENLPQKKIMTREEIFTECAKTGVDPYEFDRGNGTNYLGRMLKGKRPVGSKKGSKQKLTIFKEQVILNKEELLNMPLKQVIKEQIFVDFIQAIPKGGDTSLTAQNQRAMVINMFKDKIDFVEDSDVNDGILQIFGADDLIHSNLDDITKKSDDDVEDIEYYDESDIDDNL